MPPACVPLGPVEAPPARSLLRGMATVFVAWLLGASLVSGVVLALQLGYALAAFDAEGRLAGVLTVSTLRADAAGVAASACSVALAWATHHHHDTRLPLWRTYLVLPLAAPVAAIVTMVVGVGVTSVAYGVAPRASLNSIRELATFGDALFGLANAGALAIVLGGLARLLLPRLSALRAGLRTKALVALLATGLITGAVQAALGAFSSATDGQGARMDRGRGGDASGNVGTDAPEREVRSGCNGPRARRHSSAQRNRTGRQQRGHSPGRRGCARVTFAGPGE